MARVDVHRQANGTVTHRRLSHSRRDSDLAQQRVEPVPQSINVDCPASAIAFGDVGHSSFIFKVFWQAIGDVEEFLCREVGRYPCPNVDSSLRESVPTLANYSCSSLAPSRRSGVEFPWGVLFIRRVQLDLPKVAAEVELPDGQ